MSPQPVAPSRPPTVRLSAENIAQLQGYPRPPQDNGIGLHFHIDLRDEFITETVEHLQSIHATWTLIYAQDELQAARAATACFRAGIMPVVRIGKRIDEGFDPTQYVSALRNALAASGFPHDPQRPPLYVQVYNEPEDFREWRDGELPPDWAQIFGRNWAREAVRVFDVGGYPGIQVLERDGFDVAVDAVAAMGRQDIWTRAFFAHHNYGANHPPAYPYDEANQQNNPGQTILANFTAVLRFLAHASWMQEDGSLAPRRTPTTPKSNVRCMRSTTVRCSSGCAAASWPTASRCPIICSASPRGLLVRLRSAARTGGATSCRRMVS